MTEMPEKKDAIYEECDREIDPLREAYHQIIIADAFAELGNWDEVRRHLTSAEGWSYRARERTPEIAAMMRADIEALGKCVGNMDRWRTVRDELNIIPRVIDRVFKTFASCIRLRGTREALPW